MAAPYKLDRIRVQTARMVEIYSLLRRELEGSERIGLSPHDRRRLQHAVDTIAANMSQLLTQLAVDREHPSATAPAATPDDLPAVVYPGLGHLDGGEARKLEEILDAVLKWHAAAGQNVEGE